MTFKKSLRSKVQELSSTLDKMECGDVSLLDELTVTKLVILASTGVQLEEKVPKLSDAPLYGQTAKNTLLTRSLLTLSACVMYDYFFMEISQGY